MEGGELFKARKTVWLVDLDCPGKIGRFAVEFLVDVVAPASDGLAEG